MTRRSMIVYNYHPVPAQLPASQRKGTFIDALDVAIEGIWNPEIQALMQPIGHPQSKRFFIQQYKAAGLIKTAAKAKGMFTIANSDDWALMSALRRVAHRRGISPRQLLITGALPQAAE
jgi:hypothetical protein